MSGVSAGLGLWDGNEQEEAAVINVEENSNTVEARISALGSTSRTLDGIIEEELRFVLFNSRRLIGECRKYRFIRINDRCLLCYVCSALHRLLSFLPIVLSFAVMQ